MNERTGSAEGKLYHVILVEVFEFFEPTNNCRNGSAWPKNMSTSKKKKEDKKYQEMNIEQTILDGKDRKRLKNVAVMLYLDFSVETLEDH